MVQQLEKEFTIGTVLTSNGDELVESEGTVLTWIEADVNKIIGGMDSSASANAIHDMLRDDATAARLPNPSISAVDTNNIQPSDVFNFQELGKILDGKVDFNDDDNFHRHHGTRKDGNDWTIEALLNIS